MKTPKNKLIIIAFSLLFLLSGCLNNQAQIETSFQAANYLNPNIFNKQSPVAIVLYQLKSSTAFAHANFFPLYNDSVKTLGTDLLDKRELEIRPGQHINIKQFLSPGTTYIGILAAYRNPDKAQWRQIIPVPLESSGVRLDVTLQTQSVIAKLR